MRGEAVDCTLNGAVQIGEGSLLRHCTIRGPVVIGAGCRLSDTFIGPYTAISDGVVVEQAEIEHSIILENSRICRLGARMADSLIGRDCVIAHSDALPVAYRSWWATPARSASCRSAPRSARRKGTRRDMIDGVMTKKLKVIPDERGRLMECLRSDDELFIKFGQFYMTTTFPGVVKGWHLHDVQWDNIVCVKGVDQARPPRRP